MEHSNSLAPRIVNNVLRSIEAVCRRPPAKEL